MTQADLDQERRDGAAGGPPGDGLPDGGPPGDRPAGGAGGGTPGRSEPPPGGGGGGGGGAGDGRRVPRSRLVLYTALGVAVLVAILIALLATSKPVTPGTAGSPLVGKPAPPLSGPALAGGGSASGGSGGSTPGSPHYSLAAFSGKWVLVNFSASWCVPCREETPQLLKFQSEHAARGDATILAVSFDPTDRANLVSFLKASHADWPAVDDPQADVSYGVTGIPESYLVAPDGVVVAKFVGGVTAAEVDKVIQRATPRS